jgi:hypothetical protein
MRRNRHSYYRDWDMVIRSTVASWWKAGVIGPAYISEAPGQAIVVKDDEATTAEPEIYCDYRRWEEGWPVPERDMIRDGRRMTNPYEVDLLKYALAFSQKKPGARFALLRVWSHTHFWPLTMSIERRAQVAFEDMVGRGWEWRFIPKDMPGAEWSMQFNIEERLKPYRAMCGARVVVRRDLVLVMAADEEELRKYVVAVAWVLQSDNWRWEIDVWKSLVNANIAFLLELDRKWLE